MRLVFIRADQETALFLTSMQNVRVGVPTVHQEVSSGLIRMSLAHFLCCVGSDLVLPFEDGYTHFQTELLKERTQFIYRCGYARLPLENVLSLVA